MMKALNRIYQNLDSSLKKSGLLTRPGASNGAWTAFLLPTIIVVALYRETDLSTSFRFAAVISSGLFGATTVFISYLATTERHVRKFSPLFYLPAFITSSLLFFCLKEDISFCLIFGLGATFSYFIGLPILLERFPYSFTFGEASIVVQAVVIFVLTSIRNIISATNHQGLSDVEKATLILQVVLILYWLICSALAVLAVNYQLSKQNSASTVVRKNFHYLIVAVYIPGIITNSVLLYLSSGVILALFMVMEAMRVLKVPPLGDILQSSVSIFVDEKDQGILALTPVYLLVGCSLPLWIHPECFQGTSRGYLLALAGILTVGIGDTAASVGGVRFGRHKWPGSIKSIEGTLIAIILQLLVVCAFVQIGYISSSIPSLSRTFVVIVITSVLEAQTDQVDNLVLPLVQLLLLL